MAGPFLSASASCSLPFLSVAIYSVVNLKLPGCTDLGLKFGARRLSVEHQLSLKPVKEKKNELGKREAWFMS